MRDGFPRLGGLPTCRATDTRSLHMKGFSVAGRLKGHDGVPSSPIPSADHVQSQLAWKRTPSATLAPLLVLATAVAAIFYRLAEPAVYLWDEARIAMNAVEMMGTGNILVLSFHGQPDLWNTKPPLAVWLAALSMHVFGINEFALRLPAALASVVTVLSVYAFTLKVTASRLSAVLASAILLGTGGYVEMHVARSADFDSFLVLFVTMTTILLFCAIETLIEQPRKAAVFLYAATASLVAAVLSKGIAGLLMLPGYALYLACSGRLRSLMRFTPTWIGAGSALGIIVCFFLAQEMTAPGLLAATWNNDLAGRFARVSDGHNGPWTYYVRGLISRWPLDLRGPLYADPNVRSAFPWSWLLPPAAILGLASRRSSVSRSTLCLLCCLIAYIVTISVAATKMAWYVAPAYPLIAVLCAIGMDEMAQRLRCSTSHRVLPVDVMVSAYALALVFIGLNVWKTRQEARFGPTFADNRLAFAAKEMARIVPRTDQLIIVGSGSWRTPRVVNGSIRATEPYDGQEEFYAAELTSEGRKATVVQAAAAPVAGQVVVTCRPTAFPRSAAKAIPLSPPCMALEGRDVAPVVRGADSSSR